MSLDVRRIALFVTFVALIGCGGDSDTTATGQRLAVVGRLERGATIRLVARDGLSAADTLVTEVTVSPTIAGAVTGATVSLLQTGAITISARASDGHMLTTMVDVAIPPTVYFDGVASGNRDVYSVELDGRVLMRRTTSPADDAQPSVAAAAIVFVSMRDGNGELYSMPTVVGGAEQRLTTTAANESQPALAAGGALLAYVSDVSGAPRVYVAPTSLANPARLSAASFGFGGSIESSPTWSPTRDRLALVATANGSANLFIASAAAGAMPAVVAASANGQTDVEPAWSPDGNRLAFASTRAGTTQIFLLDLRTGVLTQATNDAAAAGQPGWLSDGRLLFTRFAAGESTLWWMDPSDPAPPTQIPTGSLLSPPTRRACTEASRRLAVVVAARRRTMFGRMDSHRLSSLTGSLLGSEILKIAADVRALDAEGMEICNLTVGDFAPSEFRIPGEVEQGIVDRLRRGETNYPPADGILALREAVRDALPARARARSVARLGDRHVGLAARHLRDVSRARRSGRSRRVSDAVVEQPVLRAARRRRGRAGAVRPREPLPADARAAAGRRARRAAAGALFAAESQPARCSPRSQLGAICDLVLEENARRGGDASVRST